MLCKNLSEILLGKHSIIHLSIYCLRKLIGSGTLIIQPLLTVLFFTEAIFPTYYIPECHLEEFKPELMKIKLPRSKIKCKSPVPT